MKILVLSDSHGRYQNTFDIVYENADAEIIIHLGDGVEDIDRAARDVADMRHLSVEKIFKVRGNCDMYSSEAVTTFENIGGHKFYITHGYMQGVKSAMGRDGLYVDARENGRDVALFGHTHKALYEERDGVYLFNPGAAKNGEYGIINIDETGAIEFLHKEI